MKLFRTEKEIRIETLKREIKKRDALLRLNTPGGIGSAVGPNYAETSALARARCEKVANQTEGELIDEIATLESELRQLEKS
jgi:hypothetical protein